MNFVPLIAFVALVLGTVQGANISTTSLSKTPSSTEALSLTDTITVTEEPSMTRTATLSHEPSETPTPPTPTVPPSTTRTMNAFVPDTGVVYTSVTIETTGAAVFTGTAAQLRLREAILADLRTLFSPVEGIASSVVEFKVEPEPTNSSLGRISVLVSSWGGTQPGLNATYAAARYYQAAVAGELNGRTDDSSAARAVLVNEVSPSVGYGAKFTVEEGEPLTTSPSPLAATNQPSGAPGGGGISTIDSECPSACVAAIAVAGIIFIGVMFGICWIARKKHREAKETRAPPAPIEPVHTGVITPAASASPQYAADTELSEYPMTKSVRSSGMRSVPGSVRQPPTAGYPYQASPPPAPPPPAQALSSAVPFPTLEPPQPQMTARFTGALAGADGQPVTSSASRRFQLPPRNHASPSAPF